MSETTDKFLSDLLRHMQNMDTPDGDGMIGMEELDQRQQTEPYSITVRKLRSAYNSLQEKPFLSVGDIVVWKERLRNKRLPAYGQPAIVVEVFDTPLYDDEMQTASQYYREPLDVRLGILDDSGNFVMYLFDSRRFEVVGDI